MDDGILFKNAQIYADRHRIQLAARLGAGFHGIIFKAEGDQKAGQTGRTAVKVRIPIKRVTVDQTQTFQACR